MQASKRKRYTLIAWYVDANLPLRSAPYLGSLIDHIAMSVKDARSSAMDKNPANAVRDTG